MLRLLSGLFTLLMLAVSTHAQGTILWWERETAMAPGGRLEIKDKPWWPQVADLEVGKPLLLASEEGGRMVIEKKERQRKAGELMLVWILDDDGDMSANGEPDTDSDCYVADYGCDGIVDRIVDYIDTDADNDPDEMDIRYFVDGELRNTWFGMDLDDDSAMWDLIDYEYTGDFFKSDPYGDNMIYMNKYHPGKDEWLPISESPFAFFDTDFDGESEVTIRFSGAPVDFSPEEDPDYANSHKRYNGPFYDALEKMAVVNVRYSFDIDGMSSPERPLHYEMGFNLIGRLPYDFPGMQHQQPLRRAPKTTICAPHSSLRDIAEKYPAEQTGFTWREFEDAGMTIGDLKRPDYDRRWEGVFWSWHRRIMHNTGGPVQDWNVRREHDPNPSTRREVYFSPIDDRIHLKGAREGWVQVGNISEVGPVGEIRFFDTNENGYFDRWEYYWHDSATPYRVVSGEGQEEGIVHFGNDWAGVQGFYTDQALPKSIQENTALVEALRKQLGDVSDPVLDCVANAREIESSTDESRYLLEIERERLYTLVRKQVAAGVKEKLDSLPPQDPRSHPVIMKESELAWGRGAALANFDGAMGRGDYAGAAKLLGELSGSN